MISVLAFPSLGEKLKLNGYGTRTKFFVDIYQIGLYVQHNTSDAQSIIQSEENKAIRIEILSEFVTTESIIDSISENLSDDKVKNQKENFKKGFKDVKVRVGSIIIMVYHPKIGTQVYLDNRLLVLIKDKDFNDELLKIWLGENPIDKKLKKRLLGDWK